MRDIVIYFVIFFQMVVDYYSWPGKVFKWRQDLVFEQRFNNASDDQSENKIRHNIQSIVEQIVEDGQELENKVQQIEEQLPIDKEVSMSIKAKKTMAIDSTIYTATYVSLIKSNKKQYKLTQAD